MNSSLVFCRFLVEKNYAAQSNQAQINCLELIAVHLNVVPPVVVREQFERLWQKVMDYDE